MLFDTLNAMLEIINIAAVVLTSNACFIIECNDRSDKVVHIFGHEASKCTEPNEPNVLYCIAYSSWLLPAEKNVF